MGLEVAAFLDRNISTTAKNTTSFIDFLALPFFKNFGKLHSQFDREVVSVLLENMQKWGSV